MWHVDDVIFTDFSDLRKAFGLDKIFVDLE